MKKQFSLNINKPCQEKFSRFTTTPKGGFCNSCKKEVIDFTVMSANAIASYFIKDNKLNVCGQFKTNQLKTYNTIPQSRKNINFIAGFGMACLTLFTLSTAQAQDTKKLTNSTQTTVLKTQQPFIVKGNVSNDLEPIPGVNIVLEGTEIGTVTDFDGNFEFPQKLNKGDVLVFSYVGLESKKIVIENKNSVASIPLDVSLKLDTITIMGEVATKQVYKSKNNK